MTEPTPALSRIAPIDRLPLFALLAAAATLGWWLQAVLVDDAYIYLRIAANIGNGQGWTYNPGELANAATSATYTLLLTAAGWLAGYGPLTLSLTYAATLAALAGLQYLAWRPLYGRALALMIAVIVAGSARMLDSAGMESALLMALVTATALAWQRHGDSWITGLLVGLCMLTRPEGVLVAALVGLVHLLHNRRIAWRSALAAVLLVAPWMIFAHFHFGGAGSHTAAVKAAQRGFGWWATQPGFATGWLHQARWPWLSLGLACAGLPLIIRLAMRGQVNGLFCVAFGVVQVSVYHLMDAPAGYHWYYVPGNVAIDLSIAVLIATGIQRLARQAGERMNRALPLAGAGAGIAALAVLGMAPWQPPVQPYFAGQYRIVGDWLRSHGSPQDAFAATEIGYLGWHAGLRVLDIHALLHPRALPALREANLHWWWDEGSRPRFIVSHAPPWHGEPDSTQTWPAALSAQFHREYHEVFRYRDMRVHERNDPGRTAAPPRPHP